MKRLKKLKKKVNNYLFDHYRIKQSLSFTKSLIIATLAAAIYAFGFDCFITPDLSAAPGSALTIVTGGVGGLSQNIIKIIQLCGGNVDAYYFQSIFYFCLNVPIIIFAFVFIGKKFAIMTAFNVGLSSLFVSLFKPFSEEFVKSAFLAGTSGVLVRVLFAGMIIGFSSALAFKNEISCGGIDVFSYYFSLRKSTSVGKYNTAINFVIVLCYSILISVESKNNWTVGIISFMFSIVYLFMSMLVVDFINIRNKKIQIQIITQNPNINDVLLANFPHGTTLMDAKGGYSGKEKQIIIMIVSSFEVSRVVSVVRKADPHSFVSVTSLVQVYGNFFIKPVE